MSFALSEDTSFTIDDAAQFESELDDILEGCEESARPDSVDLALKAYIVFAARFYDQFLQHDYDIERCVAKLLDSSLLADHLDRCIIDVVELLVTSPNPATQHLSLTVLLRRGDEKPHIFRRLRKARSQYVDSPSVLATCMALVERYGIQSVGTEAEGSSVPHPAQDRLGVTATAVLYEICRVTRFDSQELALFTAPFVSHLFRLVESTRDVDEAFNTSVVKFIISLNEQFMVASVDESETPVIGSPQSYKKKLSKSPGAVNRVLDLLSEQLGALKTFGENLIFILNRLGSSRDDKCVSLLILKMLYLLFSTPATHEYFYTNDLCVLVDVFLRELLDLPEESEGLRHTYLRVLYPLLTNTQLREHPYKRHQIRRVLRSLIADEHIRDINATTRRLAERNMRAEWCTEIERAGLTMEDAARQASAAAIDAAQISVSGCLPAVQRNSSQTSMASTTSETAMGHPYMLNGSLHTEPTTAMSDSTHSIIDVARASTLGRRKGLSTSSTASAVPSRSESPALPSFDTASTPASPSRPTRHLSSETNGTTLAMPEAFSPPSRPSSALSDSSTRRPPPPVPTHASARQRTLAALQSPSKQRRPPPARPDGSTKPELSSGLGIANMSIS